MSSVKDLLFARDGSSSVKSLSDGRVGLFGCTISDMTARWSNSVWSTWCEVTMRSESNKEAEMRDRSIRERWLLR